MLRTIVLLFTVSAVAVVAGGVSVFHWHCDAVASILDAQAATAQAMLASSSRSSEDPDRIVRALARPDVDVLLHDRFTGDRYEAIDGVVARFSMPPPGMEPPPGMPPPPPPMPAMHMRNHGILLFAHIAPRRVVAGGFDLTLLPAGGALAKWFWADVVICAIVLVALAVAAWIVARSLLRAQREPMIRTTLALEALAAGDFTPQTVEAGDSPEFARLARAYNAAAETVARSIEERRAAAAEFQRFLADAGHELRTPLTIVGGYVDILNRYVDDSDPTGRRVIAGIDAATERMRGLVEKMLLLSRLESAVSAPRVIGVAAVAEEVAESLRPVFPGRTIEVRCDPAAQIRIDEDDLYEALRNLVENALRYAPGSPVSIEAAVDGTVDVAVQDRGPGIPLDEQPMIFERFYRGKDRADSEGSGLGLAIVQRVVQRWGGQLKLDSGPGGTRFVMRFPKTAAAEEAP